MQVIGEQPCSLIYPTKSASILTTFHDLIIQGFVLYVINFDCTAIAQDQYTHQQDVPLDFQSVLVLNILCDLLFSIANATGHRTTFLSELVSFIVCPLGHRAMDCFTSLHYGVSDMTWDCNCQHTWTSLRVMQRVYDATDYGGALCVSEKFLSY